MIDIISSDKNIWEIFTRKEEYNPLILDKFDRFCYYSSNQRNITEPIVSKFILDHGFKIDYPDNKEFAVGLTHDIDRLFLSLKTRISSSVKFAKKMRFQRTIKELFKKNIYNNFVEIMNLERKYNAKSCFFFLTADKNPCSDNLYDITKISEQLDIIQREGFEIGLHGGYYSYLNQDSIIRQKKRLEKQSRKKIIGYRNHYLRFKIPDSWKVLSKTNLKYSTTMGYPDMVGFRNGMCHPFRPFDLNTQKIIDIVEIPLNIMDITLFNRMRLDLKRSFNMCKQIIDTTKKYKGVVTILWHNTSFEGDLKKLYEKILRYSSEQKGWLTSGENIYNWFDNYGFFDLF